MKYGTALHVSLSNHDFRLTYRIAKTLVRIKDFDICKDFNRTDQEGNTPLHLVMRFFNIDQRYARKLCVFLLQNGANLKMRNKMLLTPLNYAIYYLQNHAAKFAISYNQKLRETNHDTKYPMFDFNEPGGKQLFTPLHYAVK